MSEGGRHSLISSLLRGYLDKAVVWKASDASPHKANRQTFNLNTLPLPPCRWKKVEPYLWGGSAPGAPSMSPAAR
jgi:hypothetical protein